MQIEMVDPRLIKFDEDQPRENHADDHITSLALSMKHNGYRPDRAVSLRRLENQDLVMKHGEGRLRASLKADLKEIPAFIFDVLENEDESDLRLEQLMDNMGAAHTPMEIINTVERALEAGANI